MNADSYKVGDRVRRVEGWWQGMEPGYEDIVIKVDPFNGLVLKRFGDGHSWTAFEIIIGEPVLRKGFGAFLEKHSL